MPSFSVDLGKSGIREFLNKNELDGYFASEQRLWANIIGQIPEQWFNVSAGMAQTVSNIRQANVTSDGIAALFRLNYIFTSDSIYWSDLQKQPGNVGYMTGYIYGFEELFSDALIFLEGQLRFSPSFLTGYMASRNLADFDTFLGNKSTEIAVLTNTLEASGAKANLAIGKLSEIEKSLENARGKQEEINVELDELRKRGQHIAENSSALFEDKIKSLEAGSSEAMSRLEKALREDSLIAKTSEYWSGKIVSHRNKERKLAISASLYAISLVPIILLASVWFPRIFSGHQDYYVIFIFGVLLTMAFWAGRIITRTLLQEQHLASTSEERKVFIDTYLALIREGGATEAERALMLTTIFKSAPDGNKDDGMADTSVISIITKLISSKTTP